MNGNYVKFSSYRFNRIFACRSFNHLCVMYKKYGHMYKAYMESEFRRDSPDDLTNVYHTTGMCFASFFFISYIIMDLMYFECNHRVLHVAFTL